MYLAVDIGGTKTLLAVFTSEGNIKETLRFPTPHDYDAFLDIFKEKTAKLATKDFLACGAGIAASKIDRQHGVAISFGNLPWKNVEIQSDIELIIKAPAVIENDAKAGGLCEALLVKNEFSKVLYITIGTGIGIALIINGVIDSGLGDGGGRQLLLEHQGKLQPWENFASGTAIVKDFGKPLSDINDEHSLTKIAQNLVIGLIDLVAITVPDVIVIGGGVATHLDKLKGLLEKELKKFENPAVNIPPIRQAKRPEEAVLYGSYELAKARYAPSN